MPAKISCGDFQWEGGVIMETVCSWCGKDLEGGGSGARGEEKDVSHGICAECANKIFAEIGMPLDIFVEHLEAPVALVDSDVAIYSCNQKALKLLGKPFENVRSRRAGEVFDCAYAKMGCGRDVHCSACAIRNSVSRTYKTGESCIRVPAVLKFDPDCDKPKKIDLYISTIKAGDVVLLRIEKALEAT